jgi:hypothetical protein
VRSFVRLNISIILLLTLATYAGGQENQCIQAYGSASVEHFLTDLQHFVAVDDRPRVAQMVHFPIRITVDNEPLRLQNQDQLLKHYNVAFDPKVKGFIAKQKFSELFCNWKGIMVGRGEIWINTIGKSSQLRIIAINNNPPWSPEDKEQTPVLAKP